MDSRATLWHAAADAAERGIPGALATVARKRGSLPLADDAKMLVTQSGDRFGTVGGGCVEAEVTAQALATLSAGRPAIVTHTLNSDIAGDVGLSCGGTVELFLEPLLNDGANARIYREVADSIGRRHQLTVLTSLNWSQTPPKILREGVERRSSFVDERSARFVEPISRAPRVIVFGAGHVGAELVRLAAGAGFYVVAVDDREEFANSNRLPDAAEVVAEDLNAVLDRLVLEPDDFVIAATRGHAFDAGVIERTAGSAAGYVGMLGSRRKLAVVRRALEGLGIRPEHLDRVRCPIGEDIGADTPAEIAVAVVAELIRVRRKSADLSE